MIDYHQRPEISQSMLKKFAESPRLVKVSTEKTVSMNLGTCLDLALTDPVAYSQLKVKDTKTTKVEGCITQHWKQLIDRWTFDLNDYQIKVLGKTYRFEDVAKICNKQKILFWNDPVTGEPCRGKMDYYHSKFMIDLKSTSATTFEEFIRQIWKLKYYLQASWYCTGHRETLKTNQYVPFFIIGVSTVTGEIFCVEVSPELLELGIMEQNQLVASYIFTRDNNLWFKNQEQLLLTPPVWLEQQIFNNQGVL
jgi:hypothetical protein